MKKSDKGFTVIELIIPIAIIGILIAVATDRWLSGQEKYYQIQLSNGTVVATKGYTKSYCGLNFKSLMTGAEYHCIQNAKVVEIKPGEANEIGEKSSTASK